jgi:hypothetical protein
VDTLESNCKQVKRCIEIALSCVETDRHKRPTIGKIVNELNVTENMSQFYMLRNDPGFSMAQVRSLLAQFNFKMVFFFSNLEIFGIAIKIHMITRVILSEKNLLYGGACATSRIHAC